MIKTPSTLNKNTFNQLSENTLILAVICSFLLHVLLVAIIPNIKFDTIKKAPDTLNVELVQPKKTESAATQEQPKPEQPKPTEKIKPAPEPIKPPLKSSPKPKLEPDSVQNLPPAQTELPPPAVIAVAPKIDKPPVITVPPPEPPKEPLDNDDAYNAAKGSYRSGVQKEIQRNLRYPKMAEKHRVTGVAKVEIVLDKEGNISSVSIVSSSGNDALDAEAVAVINRSNIKQYMSKILSGRIDRITIPVSFTLPEE